MGKSSKENDVRTPEEIMERKARTKRHRQQCIDLAMEHMGWTRKQAKEHLDSVRAEIGISYMDYRRYYFFQIPKEQMKERYEEILQGREFRKSRKSNEKEKYVKNIMEITGWSKSEILSRMSAAKELCGATFKDYYAFRFWEIGEEEQLTYFTQKRSNALSAQYDVNEISRDVLLNKELSCMYFSDLMKRAWCINRAVNLEQFKTTFANSSKIVYKPLDGNGGHGVMVFKLEEESLEEIYDKIKDYPRGVVEDYVVQHPAMSSLAPGSVNTIRIVTFAYNDGTQVVKEGEYPVDVAYAAVRIGSGTSIVDNFTEGGFVVGVDLKTGTIDTPGVTIDGIPYENHPMTNTQFRGFKVPHFEEALALVKEAGKKIGGYTGWDIAIREDGPVLIEANIMPGNRILQMPYVKDRRGMMPVMEKYFDQIPESVSSGDRFRTFEKIEVVTTSVDSDFDRGIMTNERLARYEIKHPDYDYVKRSYVGMEFDTYDPARYVKHNNQWFKFPVENRDTVRIMFTGDITCFEKQMEEAKTGDGYDFSYSFGKIKSVFEQADLVVGNLETSVFPGAPYRTEKYVSEQNFHCNAPYEFLDAVRKAGFDMVTNANNHDLDTGAVGIGETIDSVERFGLIQTGTFKTRKKRYEFLNVDGFKVAIVAYATEHNNKQCNLTEAGAAFLLNQYSKSAAKKVLEQALEEGAEYVIACMHWGKENKDVSNDVQNQIASELAMMGYSCIIGSHPHVLQQFDYIPGKDGEIPVFFSMGNFVSHNANNKKARSCVACLDLSRVKGRCVAKVSYVPIFTSNRYGDKKYVVLPISNATISPYNRKKMSQIADVLGNKIKTNGDISLRDYRQKKAEKKVPVNIIEPDLNNVENYPVPYVSSSFTYDLYEDHACITGLSEYADNLSYTFGSEVLKLPITQIAEHAFDGNKVMKKLNFGMNVTVIPAGAFANCENLEGIQMGRRVTSVEKEAFANCGMLSSVTMRNRVETIGEKAFANDVELRSAKIPSNVRMIAEDAFENCPKLTIYCEADSYAEDYAKAKGIPFKVMEF